MRHTKVTDTEVTELFLWKKWTNQKNKYWTDIKQMHVHVQMYVCMYVCIHVHVMHETYQSHRYPSHRQIRKILDIHKTNYMYMYNAWYIPKSLGPSICIFFIQYKHTQTYIHTYIIYIYICVCVYIYIYQSLSVHEYVLAQYTHTQVERQRKWHAIENCRKLVVKKLLHLYVCMCVCVCVSSNSFCTCMCMYAYVYTYISICQTCKSHAIKNCWERVALVYVNIYTHMYIWKRWKPWTHYIYIYIYIYT